MADQKLTKLAHDLTPLLRRTLGSTGTGGRVIVAESEVGEHAHPEYLTEAEAEALIGAHDHSLLLMDVVGDQWQVVGLTGPDTLGLLDSASDGRAGNLLLRTDANGKIVINALDVDRDWNGTTRLTIANDSTGTGAWADMVAVAGANSLALQQFGTGVTSTWDGVQLAARARLRASSGVEALIIATGGAKPIIFGTLDQERMRIEGDGDVVVDAVLDTPRITHAGDVTIDPTGDLLLEPETDLGLRPTGNIYFDSSIIADQTADGAPTVLINPVTGLVDAEILQAKEAYFDALIAKARWATLGEIELTRSVATLARPFAIPNEGFTSTLYVNYLEGMPGYAPLGDNNIARIHFFEESGGTFYVGSAWGTVVKRSPQPGDVVTGEEVAYYWTTLGSYKADNGDQVSATGRTAPIDAPIQDYGPTTGDSYMILSTRDATGAPYVRLARHTGYNATTDKLNTSIIGQIGQLAGLGLSGVDPNDESGLYFESDDGRKLLLTTEQLVQEGADARWYDGGTLFLAINSTDGMKITSVASGTLNNRRAVTFMNTGGTVYAGLYGTSTAGQDDIHIRTVGPAGKDTFANVYAVSGSTTGDRGVVQVYARNNAGTGVIALLNLEKTQGGSATGSLSADTLLLDATSTITLQSATMKLDTSSTMELEAGGTLTLDTPAVDAQQNLYVRSQLGIVTTSPAHQLDVNATTNGTVRARVQNLSTGASALADVVISTGTGQSFALQKFGSGYTATWDGIGLGNYARFRAESDVNGLIFTTGGAKPIIFGTLDQERMRIDGSGRIIMQLPTSSAGLPSGALWNDSGTVKIV